MNLVNILSTPIITHVLPLVTEMGIVILTQIRFWLLCSTTATTAFSTSCLSSCWWFLQWMMRRTLSLQMKNYVRPGPCAPCQPTTKGRTMMMMLLQPPLVFSHCVLFDKLHPHGLILLLLHTSPLYRRHDYVTPAVTSSVLLWWQTTTFSQARIYPCSICF